MGRRVTCDLCGQDQDSAAAFRQHRIDHIKQRDWTKNTLLTKREIYRDGNWNSTCSTSSVANSPASSQTSPSVTGSDESEISELNCTTTKAKVVTSSPIEEKRKRDRVKCEYCNHHGTREGLVQHVHVNHPEKYAKWRTVQSSVLRLRCANCEWFFVSLDDLASHRRLVHPIKFKPPSSKPAPSSILKKRKSCGETRSKLVQLVAETKKQAEKQLKEEPPAKKRAPEKETPVWRGLRLPVDPPSSKLEAYFPANVKKCPFFNGAEKCTYEAKSTLMLETHVSRSHTTQWDYFMRSLDRQYECEVCNWRYGSLTLLKKHKTKYAKICGPFPTQISEEYLSLITRCLMFVESDPEAELTFDPTRGLIVDDVIRADETKCPYPHFHHCQYHFNSNLALEGHVSTWHRDQYTEFMTIVDRRLQCESCAFRYDDLNRLRLHKRQKEGVCDSYDITNEEQYKRTQNFNYPNMSPIAEVSIFPEVSNSPRESPKSPEITEEPSKAELKIKPKEEPRIRLKVMSSIIACPYCEVTFDLDQDSEATFNLVNHVSKSHPLQEFTFRTTPSSLLPYQCPQCQLCFVDQTSLSSHTCVSPPTPYHCTLCDGVVISALTHKRLVKNVKAHFHTHHPNQFSVLRTQKSVVYPHGCPGCGIHFSTPAQLEKHRIQAMCG